MSGDSFISLNSFILYPGAISDSEIVKPKQEIELEIQAQHEKAKLTSAVARAMPQDLIGLNDAPVDGNLFDENRKRNSFMRNIIRGLRRHDRRLGTFLRRQKRKDGEDFDVDHLSDFDSDDEALDVNSGIDDHHSEDEIPGVKDWLTQKVRIESCIVFYIILIIF